MRIYYGWFAILLDQAYEPQSNAISARSALDVTRNNQHRRLQKYTSGRYPSMISQLSSYS